jgi:hypothetical protein
MQMSMEHQWNDNWPSKIKFLDKKLPHCQLVLHKSLMGHLRVSSQVSAVSMVTRPMNYGTTLLHSDAVSRRPVSQVKPN